MIISLIKFWLQVIAINGDFPGPVINVTTNNHVSVNVFNELDEDLLITWLVPLLHCNILLFIYHLFIKGLIFAAIKNNAFTIVSNWWKIRRIEFKTFGSECEPSDLRPIAPICLLQCLHHFFTTTNLGPLIYLQSNKSLFVMDYFI